MKWNAVLNVLLVIGLLVGVFDLTQRLLFELQVPYVGDNAIFMAVGRGMLNGFTPYADLFETKPPGIFLVSALSLALTDTMVLAKIFEVMAFIGIFVTVTYLIARDTPILLAALAGIVLTLYTATRSGEFFPESFGAFSGILYVLVLASWEQRKPWMSFALTTLALLLAVSFKEPFVLSLLGVALLFSDSPLALLHRFFLPLAAALVFAGVLLLHFGWFEPFHELYLPIMTHDYFSPSEPLWVRGLAWDLLWKDLWMFSSFFAVLTLVLFVSTLFSRTPRQHGEDVAILSVGLLSMLFLAYRATFAEAHQWGLFGGGLLLLLVVTVMLMARHASRGERFGCAWRIAMPFLALYSGLLAPGTRALFLGHHNVFLVPLYAAFAIVVARGISHIDIRLRRSMSLLLFVSLMGSVAFHERLAYGEALTDRRERLESAQTVAATIDRVLDACQWERYLLIGRTIPSIFGYTRHSPLGPAFFQERFNLVFPQFRERFLENLQSAPLIVLGESPEISPEAKNLLQANFTAEAPTCAEEALKEAPLIKVLFRSSGGAVGNDFELDRPRKVDPLERSEKLICLRNSLDFVKNILKVPPTMESTLTL